jgi:hypothetical protein
VTQYRSAANPDDPSRDSCGEPIPAYTARQFCTWLEGARCLGAFQNGAPDEGQRAVLLSRLDRVLDDASEGGGCARLVRDLRGALALGAPALEPRMFSHLLSRLREALALAVPEPSPERETPRSRREQRRARAELLVDRALEAGDHASALAALRLVIEVDGHLV